MNLNDHKIIYVTRDIERALGVVPNKDFIIISNKTKYGETIKQKYPEFIHLISRDKKELLGTTELLAHPDTAKLVTPDSSILVFKNTMRVETEIINKHWKVLNPKFQLSERVENKLSQIRWLGELAKYLPSHTTKITKQIMWKNEPLIIQWAHGHTGDGTILIRTRDELSALQEKFPERMAKLSTYINGPSFTVNAIVAKDKILMGNISYQITGLQHFTDNEFSTVGNDWGIAHKLLNTKDLENIQTIVRDIGIKLQKDGWKGLFGVDFVMDEKNRRMHLIEINARQPASTIFESILETEQRENGTKGITTFEAHLRALLDLPIDQNIIEIKDGAQIVQRITKHIQGVFDDAVSELSKKGYEVIIYENTVPNSDLVRIQSKSSIMENHGIQNPKGLEITETIKNCKLNLEV
jgi:predicted ATP-grasp superfamily ATP-dependent carboligase